MPVPSNPVVQVPITVVSSSGFTVGGGRPGTLSDQIAYGPNYLGDGGYVLATVSGSNMILGMFDTYRVPDTTVAEIQMTAVARVSGSAQTATMLVDIYRSDGQVVNLGAPVVTAQADYLKYTYTLGANPFTGMLPKLQNDRLFDPDAVANIQWYTRIRLGGISGGALYVTSVYFSVAYPGYAALSGPVTDSGFAATDALGIPAAVLADTGTGATTGLGYVIIAVADAGVAVDVPIHQIRFYGAVRTGGLQPRRYHGELPQQV